MAIPLLKPAARRRKLIKAGLAAAVPMGLSPGLPLGLQLGPPLGLASLAPLPVRANQIMNQSAIHRGGVPTLEQAVERWCAGAIPRTGRVALEVAPLVDNGNAVPIAVRVSSPMTQADHVREIVVFNERNPNREVLSCQLGPLSGRAELATRIRLATSQRLLALARMSDGSVWMDFSDVVVTLAACLEL